MVDPSEQIVLADPSVIAGLDYWRELPIKQQPEWSDPAAVGRRGEAAAQLVDLAREDEGRQHGDLGAGGVHRGGVGPGRLLLDLERAPVVEAREDVGVGGDEVL